jgi:hypothetical protein
MGGGVTRSYGVAAGFHRLPRCGRGGHATPRRCAGVGRSSSPGSWFRCARHLPSSQGPLRTGQAAFPHPAPHTPPFRSICRAPYPFQLRGHAIVPLGVGRMRLLARVMVCVVPFARRALPRFFANLAAFPGTIPRPGALAAAPFTLHAVTRPEVRPRALLSPRTFNPLSGPGLAWLAL